MKKILYIVFALIMILAFSACKKEEPSNVVENDTETIKENENIEYPVLFVQDNHLYFIDSNEEYPVFVTDETGFHNFDINLNNPNEILLTEEQIKTFYLDSAPDTRYDVVDSPDYGWFHFAGYAPYGEYIYAEKIFDGNLTFLLYKNKKTEYIINNYRGFIFETGKANCFYIFEKNDSLHLGQINLETGWQDTLTELPIFSEKRVSFYYARDGYIGFGISTSDNNEELYEYEISSEKISFIENINFDTTYFLGKTRIEIGERIPDLNDYDYKNIFKLNDDTLVVSATKCEPKYNKFTVYLVSNIETIKLFSEDCYEAVGVTSHDNIVLAKHNDDYTRDIIKYNIKTKEFSTLHENFDGDRIYTVFYW